MTLLTNGSADSGETLAKLSGWIFGRYYGRMSRCLESNEETRHAIPALVQNPTLGPANEWDTGSIEAELQIPRFPRDDIHLPTNC